MFEKADLSVIIPTYNEYENILQLVEIIKDMLPDDLFTEIIIVDDNSPDGTGRLIASYIEDALTKVCSGIQQARENSSNFAINTRESIVRLVHRENKIFHRQVYLGNGRRFFSSTRNGTAFNQ